MIDGPRSHESAAERDREGSAPGTEVRGIDLVHRGAGDHRPDERRIMLRTIV